MGKEKNSTEANMLKPYRGKLDPLSAASAMQAARFNAIDLVETSQLLYDTKKYAHSMAFSILSIEESAKPMIIFFIFLEFNDLKVLWNGYRQHKYKSNFLNPSIMWRAHALFPDLDTETLELISQGPPPWYLDGMKQRALYTDCLEIPNGVWCYLPRNANNKLDEEARKRLDEANSLAYSLRDYPPEELVVWYKHLRQLTKKKKEEWKGPIKALRDELLEKGFIKNGQWDPIIKVFDNL